MNKAVLILLTCVMFVTLLPAAATPPALVNYQGVLRDAAGAPQTGSFDMVFRFYDQSSGGTLLLTDTHDTGAPSGQVVVTNGLFTAQLGAGTVTAGSEPNLAEMFRDNTAVWLEVQVETETLAPRVRVLASAYAQNASSLQGVVNVDGSRNAGVGTASPDTDLHIRSDGNLGGLTLQVADNTFSQGLRFRNAGSSYTWHLYRKDIGSNHANLVFANGASADLSAFTDVVTFEDGGQVGIGTADPGYKLDVAGDIRLTGRIRDAAGDAGTSGQLLASTGTGIDWVDPVPADDGDWTVSGNNLYAAVSGNVGIGNTSPSYRLDVAGDIHLRDSDALRFGPGLPAIGYSDPDAAVAVTSWAPPVLDQEQAAGLYGLAATSIWQSFTAGTSGYLSRIELCIIGSFPVTNGTLRIYAGEGTGGTLLYARSDITLPLGWQAIDIAGIVPVTASTVYTWHLNQDTGINVFEDNTNPYAGGRSESGASFDHRFRTYVSPSLADIVTVTVEGNVGIGLTPSYRLHLSTDSAAKPSTNTWTVASDARLKKNIRPFTEGLEVLERIEPVRYQYNGLAGTPKDEEVIGVVAQNVMEVAPYTVRTFQAKLNKDDEEKTDLLGFNSHALTFVMINAIKELDARTQGLAATVPSGTRALKTEPKPIEASLAQLERDALPLSAAPSTAPNLQVLHPVMADVEPGDVLVMNPANGEELYKCNLPADPMVVGIALEESETSDVRSETEGRDLSPLTSHFSPLTSHLSPLTSHLSPLTSHWWWAA